MNLFTLILLISAIIAMIDKATGNHFGLGKSIETGFATMGSTTVAVLGAYSIGVTFINNHADGVVQLSGILPFNPSLLMGASLCPEMGAYPLTVEMTDDPSLVVFNGIIIAGILGQIISFQFPVFMSILEKEHHRAVIKGFIVGLIIIPIGLVVGALMLRVNPMDFIAEFIPIFIICLLLAFGMLKAREGTIKIVSGFANCIQIVIYALLIIAIIGIYIPSLQYADKSLLNEALIVVLQCTVIICGALALSNTLIKIFSKQIEWIANIFGVNEVSAMSFVLNCINSLAILPLYNQMDEKGKILNAAFSVSGSYFLGGQMAFVASAVNDGYYLFVYIITKMLCGFASLLIANKLYPKLAEKI